MKNSTPNIDFMMKLVKAFVDKKKDRIDLDCDFNYQLMQRYAKMCRENEPVAETFVYYISDVFDESDNMSDSELRRKMNYGYKQVLDMLSGNIY